eukprot:2341298-Rhodomonas_salina.1
MRDNVRAGSAGTRPASEPVPSSCAPSSSLLSGEDARCSSLSPSSLPPPSSPPDDQCPSRLLQRHTLGQYPAHRSISTPVRSASVLSLGEFPRAR